MIEAGVLPRAFHLFAQAAPSSGKNHAFVDIQSSRLYGKDRKHITEKKSYPARAFFKFLGLFLGDGYTCCRSEDHPANDFFGLAMKKRRKIEAVRETLNALGIRYTETPGKLGSNTNFYCYDFPLLGFLKDLGKAQTKHIPEWVFDWDSDLLNEIYAGLIETDGSCQGKNQELYFTTSEKLADDFQRLCFLTGRSAIKIFKPGGQKVVIGENESISSDSWTLSVLQPNKKLYGENSERGSNVVYQREYHGNVYCVGVPEHHIIYTRFNGKPVWSGNSWDGSGIERDPEFWRLIWEILLPGGFVFAFSGSRTGHRQACAMETAGFIMHPMTGWVYHSGMPKAHDAAKAIDKHLGVEGSVVPQGNPIKRMIPGADQYNTGSWIKDNGRTYQPGVYMPGSDEALQWDGWAYGTATQKPALEPIYLGQKPFSEKTGAANLLKHGVGALNIDDCRVGEIDGRWPANLILDGSDEVLSLFPDSKGQQGDVKGTEPSGDIYGKFNGRVPSEKRNDTGSSARFYHQFNIETGLDIDPIICHPKAGKADRAGSLHPTVKPIALMQYLIRHITPPGGTVLDPFAGSGTTGEAAKREGFDCILMEAEPEYLEFLEKRFGNKLSANQPAIDPALLDIL